MSNDQVSSDVVKEMSKVDRSRKSDELVKRILASVSQSFSGSEQTMNWLKNVNENVPAKLDSEESEQPIVLTMVTIVDKLFDDIQRYAFQFNQIEPSRDYVVTCKRPEAIDYQTARQRYEGYCQNSKWAMLIHGEPNLIRATFVTPRFLYEAEDQRPVVAPFLELKGDGSLRHPVWKLNEHIVQFGHLPALSKAMFARIIRVSRGEVAATDRLIVNFDEQSKSKTPAPEEAHGNVRDQKFEALTNAIINLLESIDSLFPDLQKEGMVALQKDGMDVLQCVMKQSECVQSLRQRASVMAKDWAEIVRDYDH